MPQFDLQAARRAGYSDEDIANYLGQQTKYDTARARTYGYGNSEIIDQILKGAKDVPSPKVGTAMPGVGVVNEDPGIMGSIVNGYGRTADRVLDGLTQLYLKATGATPSTMDALRASNDSKTRSYQPLQQARPLSTAVGESIPSMAVPAAGPGATLAGTAGRLALGGAVPKLLEYGTPAERMQGAAAGAAGNVVGGMVVPAAARVVGQAAANGARWVGGKLVGNLSPEVLALAQKAEAMGIPVSMAQLSDSKFVKTLASVAQAMPFSGGTKFRNQQTADFTGAVARTIGSDGNKFGPEEYAAAKARLGQTFNDLTSRNNVTVDQGLLDSLQKTLNEAEAYGMPDTAALVKKHIGDLISKATPSGEIPGPAYQAFDTAMGRAMRSQGPASVYQNDIREAVRDAMDRSMQARATGYYTPGAAPAQPGAAPGTALVRPGGILPGSPTDGGTLNFVPGQSGDDAALWMLARSQYRNLKAVRDLVAKQGADPVISPIGLMQAVTRDGVGKEAMASGTRGDLGDLARVGKQFIHDPIPDSGTATRAMAIGALGGSGLMAGMGPAQSLGLMAAGATTGRAVNSWLNSPASGRLALELAAGKGPTKKLADLLFDVPSEQAQNWGKVGGSTLADLATR